MEAAMAMGMATTASGRWSTHEDRKRYREEVAEGKRPSKGGARVSERETLSFVKEPNRESKRQVRRDCLGMRLVGRRGTDMSPSALGRQEGEAK